MSEVITYCGNREHFGEGTAFYKLSNPRPKFCVTSCPPQFTVGKFIEICMEAFGRWSAVCDVLFSPTLDLNAAQFHIFTKAFDGPSGILADCMLPGPGISRQDLRVDPTERWQASDDPAAGMINIIAVMCHEIGHGIGFQHFDVGPPAELMEPRYIAGINRPQETEVLFAQKLYGPPPATTPPPGQPDLGDYININELILSDKTGTHKYRAKGKAYRIPS